MKSRSLVTLFFSKNFFPIFICQFLGAFGDNILRMSAVVLITYYSYELSIVEQSVLVTLLLGLFTLPFALFSVLGGQLADKYDKSTLIKNVKLASLVVAFIAVVGLHTHNYPLLLVSIFGAGCVSAIFGPAKYSILPDYIKKHHIIWANGLIEAATFIAILLGMVAGGWILQKFDGDVLWASIAVFGTFLFGWISSLFLPRASFADSSIRIRANLLSDILENVRDAKKDQDIFLAILGISWFWLVGGLMMAQLPNFTKDVLFSSQSVFTLLISLFSVGTGIGSVSCHRILKGQVNTEYVPISMLGMTVFMFIFWYASMHFVPKAQLISIHDFLSTIEGLHVATAVLMVGVCGGVYIVPLYALLQVQPKRSYRSRIMAGNNLFNALFMMVSSIIASIMIGMGVALSNLILALIVANFFTTVYIMRILPDRVLKSIAQTLLRIFYRVQVVGIENYYKAGEKVLIIANHTSFLDPPLLGAFLPKPLVFAIDTFHAQAWWIKPFLSYFKAFPIDPTNPMATKTLIEKLKDKQPVVIFPEGRITVTGSLMKIYEGPGLVADKANAVLLPIRIDGAQYSPFSRLKGKIKIRLFPQIKITILEPQKIEIDQNITGRQRRQLVGKRLYDVMSQMMFQGSEYNNTIFESLIDATRQFGRKYQIIEDADHRKLSYGDILTASIALGSAISKMIPDEKHVGIFLPNVTPAVATFFALQAFGIVPAMLNYSVGARNIIDCCRSAKIRHVITSKRFIEKASFEDIVESLEQYGIVIHYLEDIRTGISFTAKMKALICGMFPTAFYEMLHKKKTRNPNDLSVILFTSGSEGTPKGVALSHANIQANIKQAASCIDFSSHDKLFNALPIFHSFGMTGGLILPIICGVRTFFYPSPLHYRIIPELVYGTNSTVMFGTDTFLNGYAKSAHPYDFFSIRYIFAGAEKLREETRKLYMEKFGVRVLEAYGVTEASPAISLNTPMHYQSGSVGRLLPSIKHHIEPVDGISKGGKLVVSGPNVMLGYMKSDKPGVIQPPEFVIDGKRRKGWHDTGDIIDINEDGYIKILGRAKRFAKIGGEMISLAAVEEAVELIVPDFKTAVIAIPDDKKGEAIIMFTECKFLKRDELMLSMKKMGFSELYIPKRVIVLESMPILATGKIDYTELKTQVHQALANLEDSGCNSNDDG